jgi:ABC-type Fe3+ transport system permease subunit
MEFTNTMWLFVGTIILLAAFGFYLVYLMERDERDKQKKDKS